NAAGRPDPGYGVRVRPGRQRTARPARPQAGRVMVAAPTVLRVEDLRTAFATRRGAVRAVDGVSLELRGESVLALLGESGSGKTMTGLSIMRLVPEPGRVTGGHIWFGDRDLVGLDADAMRRLRGSGIAMVFQNPRDRLDPALTIGAQLAEV